MFLYNQTIYRFEHKKYKVGPYRCSYTNNKELCDFCLLLCEKHSDFNQHPPFIDDFPFFNYTENHYAACISLNALVTWFDDVIELLFENNFIIKIYQVKHCILSNSQKQCIFIKQKPNILSVNYINSYSQLVESL